MCVLVCPSRVVSCTSWLGLRCGDVWLGLGCCRDPQLLAWVSGCVCVYVRALLVPRLSWLGCAVWACVLVSAVPRPSWLGCCSVFAVVRVLLLPPLSLGGRLWRGGVRVLPSVGFAPPPFPLVFFGGGLCCVGRWLFRSWVLWCLSTHPFLSGLYCWFLGFLRPSVVCVRVIWVSLLLLGRCPRVGVAGFGWVVPRLSFLGGPVSAVWVGGLAASCSVGGRFGGCWPFSRPPPFSFLGGGLCLFLPLPSLGWRTHWSAFSVFLRVAVGGCVLPGRAPAPWVGRVMYTLGWAPLPAGIGSGSAGWAVAPGGFVWPRVSRAHLPPRCRF